MELKKLSFWQVKCGGKMWERAKACKNSKQGDVKIARQCRNELHVGHGPGLRPGPGPGRRPCRDRAARLRLMAGL